MTGSVLVADDDAVIRHALRTHLERWAYQAVVCRDGLEARAVLHGPAPPPLAILDWQMPGVDGPALCRELRATPALSGTYVILLTGNRNREDVISGLESGADDYVTKPCDWSELRARLTIGTRIVGLQQTLARRVTELQDALANVRRLHGLLPICAYCKRVRDDHDYWQQIEQYVTEHSEAQFSHGICPPCMQTHFGSLEPVE
jgi:DNA-binding response OmpR family regulator